MRLRRKGFENIVGKGGNTSNQHFLLLLQGFQPFQKIHFNVLIKVLVSFAITVKPVLETTCIKQSTDLRHHCSDTTSLLKST